MTADRTSGQNAAAILTTIADMEEAIGELSVAMTAQHLALDELLPDFEARYRQHLSGQRCLEIKSEYEHRIRVLREASQKLSL